MNWRNDYLHDCVLVCVCLCVCVFVWRIGYDSNIHLRIWSSLMTTIIIIVSLSISSLYSPLLYYLHDCVCVSVCVFVWRTGDDSYIHLRIWSSLMTTIIIIVSLSVSSLYSTLLSSSIFCFYYLHDCVCISVCVFVWRIGDDSYIHLRIWSSLMTTIIIIVSLSVSSLYSLLLSTSILCLSAFPPP